MKKENLVIIILTLFVFFLVVLFAVFGGKLLSISKGNVSNTTEKNSRGDVAMAMVELKDAGKELIMLQEIAQNQEHAARIEILLEKVNFYKTEFQKPDQKNAKQTLKDFYNAGLWEGIVELKNELEGTKQNNNGTPELE